MRDAGAEQGELAAPNAGERAVERRVFGFVCIQQVGDIQQQLIGMRAAKTLV
ncbi:hypothetical protein D3C73_1638970 [compost metagenome]